MTPSAKITSGLTGVIVAGVLTFGIALMLAPTETSAKVATASPAAPAAAATPAAAAAAEPTPAADDADLPEGYVSVGNGTWIPGGGPGDCAASAYIWIGSLNGEPMHAEMQGADLVDMGPQEFATGEVELDEQGRPLTYTVAPGDVLHVIGERFCIYNGLELSTLNNYAGGAEIQPGDELVLNADYAVDFDYPDELE